MCCAAFLQKLGNLLRIGFVILIDFFLFSGRLVLDVFPSPARLLFCFLMCISSQILNTHDCFHCGIAEA